MYWTFKCFTLFRKEIGERERERRRKMRKKFEEGNGTRKIEDAKTKDFKIEDTKRCV